MPDAYIYYRAVFAAALISMLLGYLWHGPLFGKQWMKLVGMTEKHKEEAKEKSMGKTYVIMFVAAFIMSYILAHMVYYIGAYTLGEGVQVGFWLWLGFIAPTMLSRFLFAVKPLPWSLYVLDSGYYLVTLMCMGGLLTVWV